MLIGITVWALFLLSGIGVLLILYGKLLRDLERFNPNEFEMLGRPSLFMYSPHRSIRLQKFIYFESQKNGIHPNIVRLSRLLGVLTPAFVILVFAGLLWCTYGLLSAT